MTANDSNPDGDVLTVTNAMASGDKYASVASASTIQTEIGQTAGANRSPTLSRWRRRHYQQHD